MSNDALDYKQISTLEKPNFFHLDRNFGNNLPNLIEDEEMQELCTTMLEQIGEECGSKIAKTAPANDEEGAQLIKADVGGVETNEVKLPEGAKEAHELLVTMGAMSVAVSDEYRGEESFQLPYVMEIGLGYLIAQADPAVYLLPMLTSGVAATIEKYADDDLKEKYLPKFCSLDPNEAYLGAMVLTEPGAGSDVGAVRTTAKKIDDKLWKINGTKTFITTPQADIHLVLARPEGAPKGTKGIGLFLVPRLKPDGSFNGVEIASLEHKMGINASATAEIVYNDCDGYAVGDPTHGFKYMLTLMNVSRLKVGVQALGIMRRSFLEAAKYAANREQFGMSIDSFPLVREMLCDMMVDTEAVFGFIFRNAFALDKTNQEEGDEKAFWAKLARIMTPQSKNRSSDWAVKNGSKCIQVFGGYGYSREYEAERMLRDAQIITLYEGTNEIQVMDVMRAIAREEVIPVVEKDIQNLTEHVSHSYLTPIKDDLVKQWTEFKKSLEYINKHEDAMNYANLVSRKTANWLTNLHSCAILLKEAQEQIDEGDGRKAVIAKRFYFNYIQDLQHHGVTQDEMLPVKHFDAIVKYAPLSIDKL